MTVKELIEELKKFPSEILVHLAMNHTISDGVSNIEIQIGGRNPIVMEGKDNISDNDVIVIFGENND